MPNCITMPDKLVTVASFTNVAEADFARSVLRDQGIDARVTNSAFVSWFWHYSNLTGGVGVLVRDVDAESAWMVLNQPDKGGHSADGPAACAVCSEPLHSGWQTCWQCGATLDGETGEGVSREQPAPATGQNVGDAIEFVGLAALVLAMLSMAAPLLLALVVLVILVFCGCHYLGVFWPDRPEPDPAGPHDDDNLQKFGAGLGEDVAARAWRAAVFGAIGFAPLICYSMYVLYRLGQSGVPLTRRARSRRDWAWWTNLMFFIPSSYVLVLLVVGLLYPQGDLLYWLFSAARALITGDVPRPF